MTSDTQQRSLRVLIVDDEAPARERMQRLVVELGSAECVGTAADGLSALELVAKVHPDVLLLDIEMPGLDGLGVAAALGESGPAVIFVTAFREYAVRAFELAAADYLTKPVRKERLAAALARIQGSPRHALKALQILAQRWEHRSRTMAVATTSGYVVFEPSRISLIQAQDHYSCIFADGREVLSDESLDRLMLRLDEGEFVRVHRSAIVNLRFIRELVREGDRKYQAVLSSPANMRVAISRDKLDALKARLSIA